MIGKRKRANPSTENGNASKKLKDDLFIFDADDDTVTTVDKAEDKKLERETPEEKRLRLAQEYLKKVEQEIDEDEELREKESQVDRDSLIANKLKQQSVSRDCCKISCYVLLCFVLTF